MAKDSERDRRSHEVRKAENEFIEVDRQARDEMEAVSVVISEQTLPMIRKDERMDEATRKRLLDEARLVVDEMGKLRETVSLQAENSELVELSRHWMRLYFGLHDVYPNFDPVTKQPLHNPYWPQVTTVNKHIHALRQKFGAERAITREENAQLYKLI